MRQRNLREGAEYLVRTPKSKHPYRAIFIGFLDDRRDKNTRRMPTYLFRGGEPGEMGDIIINHSKWISETEQRTPATHYCIICRALWRAYPGEPTKYPPTHPFHNGGWTLVSKECGKCCDNEPMGDQIQPLMQTARAGD